MLIAPIGLKDVTKKKDFWNEFSKSNSGELKTIKTISREFSRLQLIFTYKNASIVLAESDAKPLKIQVTIPNFKQKVKFSLTETDSFDRILSFFTKNKIKTNSKELDKNFLLKSNDKILAKSIFNNPIVSKSVLDEKIIVISGLTKSNTLQIEIVANRNINNLEMLNKIGVLVKTIIDSI